MKPDHLLAKLIAQAAQLTRRGSLAEATQAIQRALHLHTPPPSEPAAPPVPGHDDSAVPDGLVTEAETPLQPPLPGESHEPSAPAAPAEPPFAPAPPSAPGSPATFEEHAFATPQGSRHYKLFVPAGLRGEPAPLLVMLHGCNQNPDDFATGTRMNEVAQAHGVLVLYPAQAPRSNVSKCWNWFRRSDQQRDGGEPALLAGMTREAMQAHAVDTARVYIAGLSAGGAMAAIMAQAYPDLFAAVGVHSGLAHGAASDVGSAFSAMKNGPSEIQAVPGASAVPMIVFHGDEDSTVNPRNGEQLVAGRMPAESAPESAEAGGRRFVRTVYGDAAGQAPAEHWLVEGAGHAWSGGSAQGSYADDEGPSASREMLRFFLAHPRRA